jgi:predicted component of type VI protein secretion system
VSSLVFNEEEPAAGARHEVVGDATLGRENCDLVLSEASVSRRHAAFRMVDGEAIVEDLGSTHGTFVNDERVTGRRALMAGDRVRFGGVVVWRVVSGAPAPAAEATIAPPMRGDVPQPERVLSAVRPAIPATAPPQAFQPVSRKRIRGSAARRVEATAVSYATVAATAVALAIYFAQR